MAKIFQALGGKQPASMPESYGLGVAAPIYGVCNTCPPFRYLPYSGGSLSLRAVTGKTVCCDMVIFKRVEVSICVRFAPPRMTEGICLPMSDE